MARSARGGRGGPGYASLIIFIVLCVLLVAGYIPVGMALSQRVDALNRLQSDIKTNIEEPLGRQLRISSKPTASTAEAAYDGPFFHTVAGKAEDGLKLDAVLEVVGLKDGNQTVQEPVKFLTERFDLREGDTLLALISKQDKTMSEQTQRINKYQSDLQDANQRGDQAQTQLSYTKKQLDSEREKHQFNLNAARKEYNKNVAQYKKQWAEANAQQKSWFDKFTEAREKHKADVAKYTQEVASLETTISELRAELARKKPKPVAVTSGKVLRADAIDGMVIVNLGKREGIQKGELFTVMRPVKGGEYVPKGVIKVIRVDDLTARADILSQDEKFLIMREDVVIREKKVADE